MYVYISGSVGGQAKGEMSRGWYKLYRSIDLLSEDPPLAARKLIPVCCCCCHRYGALPLSLLLLATAATAAAAAATASAVAYRWSPPLCAFNRTNQTRSGRTCVREKGDICDVHRWLARGHGGRRNAGNGVATDMKLIPRG